jgi:hypothetical protein
MQIDFDSTNVTIRTPSSCAIRFYPLQPSSINESKVSILSDHLTCGYTELYGVRAETTNRLEMRLQEFCDIHATKTWLT